MVSRGKVKYLKSLYPLSMFGLDTWEKIFAYLRTNKLKHRVIKASMPRHEPASILRPGCDGIYPVRENLYPSVEIYRDPREYDFNPFVRQVATKGYYDGCKRLDSEVDLEAFFYVKGADLNSFTIERGKERDPTKGFEQVTQ